MRRSAGRGRLKLRAVPVNAAAAAATATTGAAGACTCVQVRAADSSSTGAGASSGTAFGTSSTEAEGPEAASSATSFRAASAVPSKPPPAAKKRPARPSVKAAQRNFMSSWLAGSSTTTASAPSDASETDDDDDDQDIYSAASEGQRSSSRSASSRPTSSRQPGLPVDLTGAPAVSAVVDLTAADEPSLQGRNTADQDEAASLALAQRLQHEEQESVALVLPVRNAQAPSSQRSADDLEAKLKHHFGHSAFRCKEQRAAVKCVLAGRDCVLLMPTGMGKSLCFQLPAMILNERSGSLTVVVSPLLALMSEQVQTLRSKGKNACMINSLLTGQQRKDVFARLNAMAAPLGKISMAQRGVQLLYVTPESLTGNDVVVTLLQKLHRHGRLGLFAVDEAHCIASWGHDFRPAYRRLGDVRNGFLGVPCIALTATATDSIREDISKNLNLQNPDKIRMSFDRPNIYYSVKLKSDLYARGIEVEEDIVEYVRVKHDGESGIIYCHKKTTVESVAMALKAAGVSAAAFHGSVKNTDKDENLRRWLSGDILVMCATVAFGMGVDKADVRFVVHHDMPKSPEGLVQEAGRAGRDRLPAESMVYFWEEDLSMFQFLAQKSVKEGDHRDKSKKEIDRLQKVADWCNDDGCHRAKLLSFFGEQKPTGTPAETCCYNCERRFQLRRTGVGGGAARSGGAAGTSNYGASSSSFQSAGGGVFTFRGRGRAAGGASSTGSGGSRAFQFSRGTSMASTKFKAPRRLGDDATDDGGDNEVDREGGSVYSSSSSFVFRGGGSFQSARWQGSHEGFEGGSGGSYSHGREEAEEPLRGQALMNAARARAEAGPSFSSATRRPATSGGLAKKKKLAKTVDLF